MALIPFKKAERNSRRALTNEELKKMLNRLNMDEFSAYKQTFLILLFFGLRPCELEDARFEGDFLIARNAKRKNGKIEYKKIPICKQAREMLDLDAPIVALHRTDVLNRIFKRIMDDEEVTQYFLRHTFATVCQQYVRPDIVDIWMGDSSERLVGRVYTHFPDKFMIEQMQSVVFEI
jgi:integrase